MVLDVALLTLARQRGWTRIVVLCLGATLLYEAGWIFFRLDHGEVGIGLGVIALFAVTFGAARDKRQPAPIPAAHLLLAPG